jgi:RHS repeat-associated protein
MLHRFMHLGIAVLLGLASWGLQAQSGGTCSASGGGNPGSGGGPGSTPPSCDGAASRSGNAPAAGGGNPIHLISGNKYQQEVDMARLPGVLGLELIRHYNSQDAHRGLVGANWRIGYEAVLYDFGDQLQIVQSDGRRLMFKRPQAVASGKADSSNAASAASTPTVCAATDPADGQVLIHNDHETGAPSYHWRWPDGRTLVFGSGRNGGHPLQSIRAASGELLTLRYAPSGELVQVSDPQGRRLTFIYDKTGALQAIRSPLGELRYSRDAQHRLNEVQQWAQGQWLSTKVYHHEAERQSGHARALTGISLVSPDGVKNKTQRLSTYAYDAQGRAVLSTKGWPKDSSQGQSKDRGIEQIMVQYHEAPLPRHGRVNAAGEFVPSQVGVAVLTNSLGQTSRIDSAVVAGQLRLLAFTGAGCATCPALNKRYTYNALGQVIAEQQLDAQGKVLHTLRLAYDSQGRLAKQDNGKHYARYKYEGANPQPVLIAAPSVVPGQERITRIAYNERGQPTEVSEQGFSPIDGEGQPKATAISRATRYSYSVLHGRSLLTAIDGPLPNGAKNSPEDSDITVFDWDEEGRFLIAITRPMNLVERFEHDEIGRLVQTTDADGVQSHWRYASTSALQPSAIVRADVATGYAYDALGRLIGMADTAGRGIALTYDAAGRMHTVRDAQGFKQELTLDSEGKLLRAGLFEPGQIEPLRAAYRFYDAQQRLSRHLLPDGRISAYTYDDSAQGRGRLIEHSDGDEVLHLHRLSAQGLQARIDLAPDGLMRAAFHGLRLNTPSQPHRQLDDFGRLVWQWRPEQGLTTYRLKDGDGAGNWRRSKQRDRTGQLAVHREQDFDAAGRLLEQRTVDLKGTVLQRVRYQYQGLRLSHQSDDAQDMHYRYDPAGRVVATTLTLKDERGQAVFTTTLETEFDAQGQPMAKTLADGQTLRIERDTATGMAKHLALQSNIWAKVHTQAQQSLPASWAAAVQGWLPRQTVVQQVAFHPYNGITGFTLGNGLVMNKQFDIAGRMTRLNIGAEALNYDYGVGSRVRKINDQAFEYDGFGQLKDPSTTSIVKTATDGLTVNTQLAKMQLDSLGRVVNDGINRYSFTADGQVQTVLRQDGTLVASYRYNAQRQRVSKTVYQTTNDQASGSRTTYFLWSEGTLVAEVEGSRVRADTQAGRINAQYLYLSEADKAQPIAKLETAYAPGNRAGHGRTLFIHANHRGEPMAMSDGQKRVVWQGRSDAWGYVNAAQLQAQDAELNIRLPGQYLDVESGLHDNWHRSYDPRPQSAIRGSYLSPDQLGYPDGPDTYAYVNGDPINKVDPLGLYTVYWGGAGLDGPYIEDQISQLMNAGLTNIRRGTGSGGSPPFGMLLDANAVINLRSYPPRYGYITPIAPYAPRPRTQKLVCDEQTNYIGYSYGALLAAHTAMHYASQGNIIDNVVLVGAPIDASFLRALENHTNINNVIVINLREHGDPIYAGMSEFELLRSIPNLASDVGTDRGHFYYSQMNAEGRIRRATLASRLHREGLR